jgi:LemA protein
MTGLWILLGLLLAVAAYIVVIYNGLVQLKNRVDEAFSDISVQQKRRWDLIPNLVNTVKGYASHERETLENVTKARTQAMQAGESGNVEEMARAENMLSGTLRSIFALSESYPDLKANQNFLHLQQELVDAEDKIQAARRFYNANVQRLNTRVEQFPANVIASQFSFGKREFFKIDEGETVAPSVRF